jgi:hypothetical protein
VSILEWVAAKRIGTPIASAERIGTATTAEWIGTASTTAAEWIGTTSTTASEWIGTTSTTTAERIVATATAAERIVARLILRCSSRFWFVSSSQLWLDIEGRQFIGFVPQTLDFPRITHQVQPVGNSIDQQLRWTDVRVSSDTIAGF